MKHTPLPPLPHPGHFLLLLGRSRIYLQRIKDRSAGEAEEGLLWEMLICQCCRYNLNSNQLLDYFRLSLLSHCPILPPYGIPFALH